MKEIYIIRHGETQYNLEKRIQGQGIDAPINQTGHIQAKAFFESYNHIPFEIAYYSSLQRTYQTIEPFLSKGLKGHVCPELNEISWGDWEGKQYDPNISATYKTMIKEWGSGNKDYKIKNGESAGELSDRLSIFWNRILASEERTILICSHGRAMRCLMTVIFDEQVQDMEKYTHHNTGLYKIHLKNFIPGMMLANDTTHLEKIKV